MVPRQKQAPDSKPVSYTHSNMKQYVAVTLIFGFMRGNLVQKIQINQNLSATCFLCNRYFIV